MIITVMTRKSIGIQSLEREFTEINSTCDKFCTELTRQISRLISIDKISLAVPIQNRTKKWESIVDKISQGRYTIKDSILELQDLIGLRIILLFKRDTEQISKLIKNNFKIIKEYNTEDRLEENQFGYSSIHIIVELEDDWLKIPTFKEFKGLKAEIQIRTLAQHAWAEASNIFQYKAENSVPKPLKRAISRISAVLEIVDLEFERILDERNNYKVEIEETSFDDSVPLKLNVDLLSKILDEKLPDKNKRINEDYSVLLTNLNELGILTNFDLISLIENYLDETISAEKRICEEMLHNYAIKNELTANDSYKAYFIDIERIRKGIFFTHSGLVRNMLNIKLGRKWFEVINEMKANSKNSEIHK